jgi:hypothetical protein
MKNEMRMTASHEVVVGLRHYEVHFIEPGRWSVSRGGIPTGYIHQKDGECSVAALGEGETASDELSGVLEEAKKQTWWR